MITAGLRSFSKQLGLREAPCRLQRNASGLKERLKVTLVSTSCRTFDTFIVVLCCKSNSTQIREQQSLWQFTDTKLLYLRYWTL